MVARAKPVKKPRLAETPEAQTPEAETPETGK
eukprot:CAMPEP_0177279476 /NCGR_PEP_ID=MMETSP0367-20130122/69847_1 /TAXON_ID=447022 ORGANISM="Scrippsiella hangoei-like, Strain SHHI-4" /NCGR_SAMPLE_ID=MMETSP0367 /ASSEMBLY_ACC=CAM_ASM_000362 /LENGTH=31 /DNA_ID= /DNA_START= /DNA_END= /DNA_ORIENTATION=